MRPNQPRPPTAGAPTGPTPPFPIPLSGPVVKGFGRGSKDLGIPTANIPLAGLSVGGHEDVESGVYFGWAGVDVGGEGEAEGGKGVNGRGGECEGNERKKAGKRGGVWPMVMSIGWNPFYGNTVRSVVSPFPPRPTSNTFFQKHHLPVLSTRTRTLKKKTTNIIQSNAHQG